MPFLVQLRDLETWMPLKGVQCGDMGPKMGYNSKNNGWVIFDKVRIPRDQLLMRFVEVDREGAVSIKGDSRVLYSVMMDIRIQLILHSGNFLLKASLIALRYSACRRQFKFDLQNKKKETRLIDYQSQQMKLFPLVAQGYAFLMCHAHANQKYKQLMKDIKVGNFALMDELHHFTSGMKSTFTQQAMDGLMVARQSTGGAGYTAWSGLPYLIDDFSPCVTYEGDNTVMAQQSSKYLMKLVKKVRSGKKLDGVFSYLNELPTFRSLKCSASAADQFTSLD